MSLKVVCGANGLKVATPCGTFTVLDPCSYKKTLVQGCLGSVVDRARDIYTQFGLRPYLVRMVKTRWSGGRRGIGTEEVLSEELILPTPLVSTLNSLDAEVSPIGNIEQGGIKVEQISSICYTEDMLMGRDADGEPVPRDQQFYYEIEMLGQSSIKRRFTPAGAPSLDASKFQWVIELTKSNENRTRDGTPED